MDASNKRLLIFILSLLLSSLVFGQGKNQKRTDQLVVLSKGAIRLDSLLKKVTKQTGFIFSYNSRKVNHSLSFSLTKSSYSLGEILLKVKEKTGLDYSIAEDHIILKATKSQSPSQVTSRSTSGLGESTAVGKSANRRIVKMHDARRDTLSISAIKTRPLDSTLQEDKLSISKGLTIQKTEQLSVEKPVLSETDLIKSNKPNNEIELRSQQLHSERATIMNDPSQKNSVETTKTENKNLKTAGEPTKSKKNKSSFTAMVGLGIDETFYLGPALQIGIPVFFATASYKSDFTSGLFSYGLGSSIKLSDTWRLNVVANIGNVSKLYDSLNYSMHDSTLILIHHIIQAKSSLTRVGLLLEKKLSTRFTLQAGVQYNSLVTNYSANGAPISIGSYGNDADREIHTIVPPYLLNNTYSPTSSTNKKDWIGIQVNLFYVLDFSKRK